MREPPFVEPHCPLCLGSFDLADLRVPTINVSSVVQPGQAQRMFCSAGRASRRLVRTTTSTMPPKPGRYIASAPTCWLYRRVEMTSNGFIAVVTINPTGRCQGGGPGCGACVTSRERQVGVCHALRRTSPLPSAAFTHPQTSTAAISSCLPVPFSALPCSPTLPCRGNDEPTGHSLGRGVQTCTQAGHEMERDAFRDPAQEACTHRCTH